MTNSIVHEPKNVNIERAIADDIAAIKAIVNAAYSKYTERLGKPPAPMSSDYHTLVAANKVYVLRASDDICGSIVLDQEDTAITVNNLVVHPNFQGLGFGRALMEYAEKAARTRGLKAVSLFTNEKMHENIEIYTKMGFKVTERKTDEGFSRVYFRKTLL